MIIDDANIAMKANRVYTEQHEKSERLDAWVGERGQDEAVAPIGDNVDISSGAFDSYKRYTELTPFEMANDGIAAGDPLYIMKLLLEKITGMKIDVSEVEEVDEDDIEDVEGSEVAKKLHGPNEGEDIPESAGFGISYEYRESYYEREVTEFSASGVVKTADGQEISFDINLKMEREFYSEESFSFRAGDALVDPLVINYSGNAASLTNVKFKFDLDSDGTNDNISRIAPGSGILVYDKNGDGKVNNGTELFGPNTGNGFAELAAYDLDGNGWIDERDDIFSKLQIWEPDIFGKDYLKSLQEISVGAIYLNSKRTDFDMKNAQNGLDGQIARTGIYLTEDGKVNTIQQLNLAV